MRNRLLLSLSAAVGLTLPASLHAQPKVADPEAYRAAKKAATATFLDSKRPKEARLAATKDLGYPEDETLPAFLAIGADQSQDDAIRWEALRRHPYDDKYLEVILKILDDPKDGGEELDANLIEDVSRRTTSSPPAGMRQRIQATLRKLLNDPRDKVRLYAYRASVANHDPVAVNLLADSLRKVQNPPIPLPDAIHLLNEDGSVNHIGALRPYLSNADPRVQAQAVQALAVDPESRPKIVDLARNPETPGEVRLRALRGLAREDAKFADYAIPLMEDTKANPKVRDAAMQGLAGRLNYQKTEPALQIRFAEAVEKIAADKALTTGDARTMREAAEKLHPFLRKSFPEIQKHYENR